MDLILSAVEAVLGPIGAPVEEHVSPVAELSAQVPVAVGPLEVVLIPLDGGLEWSVMNRGDHALGIRSVSVVAEVRDVRGPLRMFRHGYQSWSPSGVATLCVDEDPSRRADFPFVQGVYHADSRTGRAGELRSEWCTVLADGDPTAGRRRAPLVAGFGGGHEHDGTFRLRRRNDGRPEIRMEAFLGDAVLQAGESRALHGLTWSSEGASASESLARWAAGVGRAGAARVGAPFAVGWCSWYHFFGHVTEADVRRNLAEAAGAAWPFDVFQVDDGFQAAIGDWTATNETFPSDLADLAAAIRDAGMRPGLWLAPFLAAPDSAVARAHPEWMARRAGGGEPVRSWWNPDWGGGEDGFMYSLDTTRPEVLAHLEGLARDLVEAGFTYLKLDFTFAPSVDGRWHDAGRTPAQRVRAGFDAIRRGAGEEAFLLGCGVPLSNVVGVVDANRIGADVAPRWSLEASDEIVAGYLDVHPATRAAFAATLARSFMHRQLWVNDPDCVMLRTSDTALSAEAAETWARCAGLSGGLVLVSDDLEILDRGARARLDEVIALGRASDEAATAAEPARCPDLLVHAVPTTISAAGRTLTVDTGTGTSRFATSTS